MAEPTMLQKLLGCGCLPDTIFGKDLDDLLVFQTVRVEMIRDRSLGLISKILSFLIFVAVVIVQILYQGKHFRREAPHGIQRVTLQQPVQSCNPSHVECRMNYTSVDKLAYCEQHAGASPLRKRNCEYFDEGEVLIPMQEGMLLRSYTKSYKQRNVCLGFAKAGKPCPRKWAFEDAAGALQEGTGKAEPLMKAFIADLEDFTILIDHSVQSETIAYDDGQMFGHYKDCPDCESNKIVCVHSRCKDWGMYTGEESEDFVGSLALLQAQGGPAPPRGAAFVRGERAGPDGGAGADEEEAEEASLLQAKVPDHPVISVKLGDVLTVRTLLALAGLSLDDPPTGYRGNSTKAKGKTIRSEGTAIVVGIHYWNHRPWTFLTPSGPPSYEISVTSRPVFKFKQEALRELDEGQRDFLDHYGVYFIFDITGELCVFSVVGLVLILTTSLGLLAVANLITETIAFNFMKDAEEYKQLKYRTSKDFHP